MSDIIEDLVRDEALRLRVYDDATGLEIRAGSLVKGNPTIGVGRELSMRGITQREAMFLLARDIEGAEADLDRTLPWWRKLSENRQRGLLNMAVNLGIKRLCGFTHLLKAMEEGRWGDAADEALASVWARQVKDRAVRISELFRNG